jgi:hypothetical protein
MMKPACHRASRQRYPDIQEKTAIVHRLEWTRDGQRRARVCGLGAEMHRVRPPGGDIA